ncbi:MAG: FtsW/RodA/SpoVE family cell cycle protein [Oscillospiraceae bacterium]|nr:FtsW/RodA/SpoVE family cell cycle protein [Oscillospiraceae bacterium]
MRKVIDAVYKYVRESDTFLLVICLISSVYGLLLIKSTTRHTAGDRSVLIQIIAMVLGIGLYILMSLIDIDTLADKSRLLFFVSAAFISTLFIWGKAGDTVNKAWLRFGNIGIQPAEVVKVLFIIIIAHMMSDYRDRRVLNSPMSLLKIVLVFGALFALILVASADLGSALVYVFIMLIMLFVAGTQLRWFAFLGALVAAATPLVWKFLLTQRHRNLIMAPYDPTIDKTGLGITWQPKLSKNAIAAGKFFGQGLFKGKITQSGNLPQQRTDFIFATAGEELGFIGCIAIVALLVIIISRCVYVGVRSNNSRGLLVCVGIAAMLLTQTLENIGMCMELTPVIGLTLPFFSYGGSSVVTNFAAMGIISGIKMRPKPTRFRYM